MNTLSESAKKVLWSNNARPSSWENEEFRVKWEGLVFVKGVPSGGLSIRAFIARLKEKNIEDASLLLKGTFFITVESKATGEIHTFVDNSGLYQAFYTEESVSSSFLELVGHGKCGVSDLDPEAVSEFLYFGTLFFNKTFFRTIQRVPGDKIIRISRSAGKITMLPKNGPAINDPFESGPDFFYSEFKALADSLRNRRVSIDLTGGFDSRLIALMLDHFGLNFETAISAGTAEYEDVLISGKVANSIGHPWFSTIHSIGSLEQDVPEMFLATEGLYNVLYFHRLFQLQKARSERGVNTIISGAGGELFKDLWWMQDFPFYSRRSSNIGRLADLRIMISDSAGQIMTGEYSRAAGALRNRLVLGLSQYALETNTRTYDNIFFNFKMREEAGRELTNYNPYVKSYAPFLDMDIARSGFMLPRMARLFNMFHRRELTRINPAVARMPTTDGGVSASSEALMLMTDVPGYMIEKIGRLIVKLKLRKQKKFDRLNHPGFYPFVRSMNTMLRVTGSLKDAGIIKKGVEIQQLEDGHLGKLLSLGMLIEHLQEHK